MSSQARALCSIVLRSSERRACLRALRDCGPKQSFISAGFVRNALFSERFGAARDDDAVDLDVIYLDPTDQSRERDLQFERALFARHRANWSVKNQARMALRNGHDSYRDLLDALSYFPETATAVAVRLGPERLEILAPFGLDDLFAGIIRPSPRTTRELFMARCAEKAWSERFPSVRVVAERRETNTS